MISLWIVNFVDSKRLSARRLSCFMESSSEAMEEYEGERRWRVAWRWVEGAWVSRRRCICVLNWSAVMSGWTVVSEATSCLNCSLSIARRFRVVCSTGHNSGFKMSREHISGRWSEDRLWQTDTEQKRESSSLWTTRSRVCPQRWVGTLTAWQKRKVCSMSTIRTVLELVGLSKWKLKSPTISTLPPGRLQWSRKSQNSERRPI